MVDERSHSGPLWSEVGPGGVEPKPDPPHLGLGTCCVCERAGPTVRNVVLLDLRSPTPGHGWGCMQCGRPPDGAVAVVCDACVRAGVLRAAGPGVRFACRDYPETEGRVPIGELTEPFTHDLSRHPEAEAEMFWQEE